MVSAFFGSPRWTACKRKDGFYEITASGAVRFQQRAVAAELMFLGSRHLSTIVPYSLTIDGRKMSDIVAYQFLRRMYDTLFPDSSLLVGEWTSDYVYRRSALFTAAGTFELRSWPHAVAGSYEVASEHKTLLLYPNNPSEAAVRVIELRYSFTEGGDLLLTDPGGDIFLFSGPIVFRRVPRPQLEEMSRASSDPPQGVERYRPM